MQFCKNLLVENFYKSCMEVENKMITNKISDKHKRVIPLPKKGRF